MAARSGAVFKTNLIALAGRIRLVRDAQIRVGTRADRSVGTSLEPLLARLLALTEPDTGTFVNILRLPATFGNHEKECAGESTSIENTTWRIHNESIDAPQVIPIVLFLGLDAPPGILLPELVIIVLITIDQL